MSRGYTVFPAKVKPHIVAAVFNMETPIDDTEQGQIYASVHKSDC